MGFMAFFMICTISLRDKSLRTNSTSIRLFTSVSPNMVYPACFVLKSLPTVFVGTHMRFTLVIRSQLFLCLLNRGWIQHLGSIWLWINLIYWYLTLFHKLCLNHWVLSNHFWSIYHPLRIYWILQLFNLKLWTLVLIGHQIFKLIRSTDILYISSLTVSVRFNVTLHQNLW